MLSKSKTENLPFYKKGRWLIKSDYPLLNALRDLVWFLRLVSPVSWISPFIVFEQEGRRYSHPYTAEVYLLISTLLTMFISFYIWVYGGSPLFAGIWSILIIVENIQYQIQTIFLRPVFQSSYRPYSAVRTLSILVGQYLHTTLAFSLVFFVFFSDKFVVYKDAIFSLPVAFEFSIITITTLGYGSIFPEPGSIAAILAGIEAILGVFFLGLFISIGASRATSGVNAVQIVSDTIQRRCFNEMAKLNYLDYLQDLGNKFNGKLWIVGGWVRGAALRCNYIGDIDCVVSIDLPELESRLHSLNVVFERSSLGAYRIKLFDGNHLDIVSTFSHCNSSDIVETLTSFNFTANAAAINLSTSQFVSVPKFESYLGRKCFDLQKKPHPENDIKFLRDFEVLSKYYKLEFVGSSEKLQKEIDDLNESFRVGGCNALLCSASDIVKPLLPKDADAWIVRGYPRAALLGELHYWDDIDVVANCNEHELLTHLNANKYTYSLNYYGHPKVRLTNNLSVDIWALPNNQSLADHLLSYSHINDMLAWNVKNNSFDISSHQAIEATKGRKLIIGDQFLANASSSDISYCMVKTIYLLIRHQFSVSESVLELFQKKFLMDSFLKKNIYRLIKELHLCGVVDIETRLGFIESQVTSSDLMHQLRTNWNPMIQKRET